MGSAQEAVEGADIICTVTTAREPVVLGDWLAPGATSTPWARSRRPRANWTRPRSPRARLYVDRRESMLNEAGEFLIPRREGVIGDDHIAGELGELLLGKVPGRGSADEITLFKSLGIAIEDLAAAHHIWRKAEATGAGTWVEIGGRHYGSMA